MKLIDLALNAAIIFSAMIFLAYVGFYYFDFGLFKVLPQGIADFFLGAGALQYVALAILVAGFIAKVPVGRAIKRQEAGNRN